MQDGANMQAIIHALGTMHLRVAIHMRKLQEFDSVTNPAYEFEVKASFLASTRRGGLHASFSFLSKPGLCVSPART